MVATVFSTYKYMERILRFFDPFAFSTICNGTCFLEQLWKTAQFSRVINIKVFAGQQISSINVSFQVIRLHVRMWWMYTVSYFLYFKSC